MPGALSSFLLLVVRPGAPSSVRSLLVAFAQFRFDLKERTDADSALHPQSPLAIDRLQTDLMGTGRFT